MLKRSPYAIIRMKGLDRMCWVMSERLHLMNIANIEHAGYYVEDLIGKDGLEVQYDRYLHGQHGGRQILVDAQGRPMQELARRPIPTGSAFGTDDRLAFASAGRGCACINNFRIGRR